MSSVVVAVRVRPFNQREIDDGAYNVIRMTESTTTQIVPPPSSGGAAAESEGKKFTFDHSFWSFSKDDSDYATQEHVFESLGRPILTNAFDGYNSCLFAYGQTGSGKTYTMMGYGDDTGVVPRLCRSLFDQCSSLRAEHGENWDCHIRVSYLEIYNERCRCLLNPQVRDCKPREHPVTGPYVEGLSEIIVRDFPDIERLMEEGNKTRTVACTQMNATSSRSHAIFTLHFTQLRNKKKHGGKAQEMSARINLVDLAGSERADKTGATGATLKEGANINKSLVCLGKVIAALADASAASEKQRKKMHIPFRDSALTWVLKENLGGNSKTVMLAALSPHAGNYEESLSTLRYADRAKRIKTHAVKNEDPTTRRVRELEEEIERLKALLLGQEGRLSPPPGSSDAASPRDEDYETLTPMQRLQLTAAALKDAQMSWEDQEAKDAQVREERTKALAELGIGVEMDRSRPSLVNLNEDPFMSGCLVYYLIDDGVTKLGSGVGVEEKPDIKLEGEGIEPEHCEIDCGDSSEDALPVLRVRGTAKVYVNGSQVHGSTELAPRSRLIFGEHHVFRLSHPRLDKGDGGAAGFDFAAVLKEKMEKEKEAFKQAILDEVVREDAEREEAIQEMEREAREKDAALRDAEEKLAAMARDLQREKEAKEEVERQAAAAREVQVQERQRSEQRERETRAKAQAAVSKRAQAAAPAGGPGAKHVDVSLFSNARRDVKRVPPQLIRKFKVVLVGHEEVGKTSLRKCWQADPMFFKRLPEVQCTTGIEVQNHTLKYSGVGDGTSGSDELDLSVCDFAGQEVYHSHSLFLTPRTVYVFVWKMSSEGADGGMSAYEEERIMGWIDEVYAKAPDAAVFLVGTHQDELGDRKLRNLNAITKGVKERVREYMDSIVADGADGSGGLRLEGSYAVSCKTRQVWCEEFQTDRGSKMSDLLKSIGQRAFQDCLQDFHFPNGAIPGRELQFMRDLERLKKERKKLLLSIQEYQRMAADFGIEDAKELHAITNLFHCWNVVYIFSQSKRLEDNPFVFLYPMWLSHMVSALFSFAHVLYTPPEMRRYIGGLDYDVDEAMVADRGCMRQGELSFQLARVVLLRSIRMVRGEKDSSKAPVDPADLEMCFQLLTSLDLVYREEITERERRRAPQTGVRYCIPSLFPGTCPTTIKEIAPYLFQKGFTRMYQFNIFPRELFFRVICRLCDLQKPVAVTLQQRPDVGSDEKYLPSDWTSELRSHWRDGMWIGCGEDVRSLIYQEDTLIYVHTAAVGAAPATGNLSFSQSFGGRARPSTPETLMAHVDEVIRCVAEEYTGVTLTCCIPSPGAPGENWFDLEMVQAGGAVECQKSGRSFTVEELLKDGAPAALTTDVAAGELWPDLWQNLTTAQNQEGGAAALLCALGCYIEDPAIRARGEEVLAGGGFAIGDALDKLIKVILFLEAASGEALQGKGRSGV